MTPEEANRAKQYLKEMHGINDEFLTVQSANGLCYPLIDLMVAYAKHEAKFISSNLPVMRSLPTLEEAFNAGVSEGMDRAGSFEWGIRRKDIEYAEWLRGEVGNDA